MLRELERGNNASNILQWYLEAARLVEPAPLGKARSRDARNDPFLAVAIAARTDLVVSYDKDLLVLNKPFGIGIICPARFLQLIRG